MTPKEIQKEHMLSCMKAALAMWDLCDEFASKQTSDAVLELGVEEIRSIMVTHFPLFTVTDDHLFECLQMMEKAIDLTGITSCGCFNYAHMLDHVFDLEKLGIGETQN